MHEPTSWATFAGRRAHRAVECVDLLANPERLDAGGLWFVVADFEADFEADPAGDAGARAGTGSARAWRFAEAGSAPSAAPVAGADGWRGPAPTSWSTSMDRDAYCGAVARVRDRIREGDVYQVNVCRVLRAPLPVTGDGTEPDAAALAARLAAGNPAPYAAAIHVPASSGLEPAWVVSASPELYLGLERDSAGATLTSGPIKGTARTPEGLAPKDRAENVMITDLVRNDLQRVCRPGSVAVTDLLALEEHPGLVHLVSRVRGRLSDDVAAVPGLWGQVLAATFPPGSVSGAPKSSALRLIRELETTPRGPYCGAVGWIDADAGRAELAVGIRTFWWSDGVLRFGTGAGITWGSDPAAEWAETELKAARLVGLASTGDHR
ncbi:anthranilate synthase component I family protein [Isoptericola sp. NEAU-Y5]|uniref:Anthranilate synthase component I family protein n=1 Tax=Isoptericola luteus TaxID=2879484 RepID=A0ABS7ZGA3_9MICO|nr:anthranilate synthase component I family protein [Isoptericola sp. NEAU-Y5]MCA5893953.1 anthranilate synthase component I family protein [Isoptericola sp. NEAU-Y5]